MDVLIHRDGQSVSLLPQTRDGLEWLADNIIDEATWRGSFLIVDAEYAKDLISGLLNAGLDVYPPQHD